MKISLFISAILLLVTNSSTADNVYLNNGYVYRNVKVSIHENKVTVDMEGRSEIFDIKHVIKIVSLPYESDAKQGLMKIDPKEISYYESIKKDFDSTQSVNTKSIPPNLVQGPLTHKTYPNGIFILAALVSAGIAWDQFADASDISEEIDVFKKISTNIDVSGLEGARTRKYIIGVVAGISAIGFTAYAAKPVTVIVSADKVNVAYNF